MRNDVRDFIYLDWERVRSLVAQLELGIPEQRTGSLSSEEGNESDLEVGLAGLLRGELKDDVRYVRSATETRSLHHAIFSAFEKDLADRDAIRSPRPWAEDTFVGGGFFRVDAAIRFVDYSAIASLAQGLQPLMEVGYEGQKSAAKKELSGEPLSRRLGEIEHEKKAQLKDLRSPAFERIAGAIEQLFGTTIRLKILPDPHNRDELFVGVLPRELIDATLTGAIGTRGTATLPGLTALLYVPPEAPVSLADAPLPTGNQIDDAMDEIVTSMDALATVAGGYEFPVVNCIPIAIYRVVIPGD